ncbi:MAG: hypothetical protein KGP34_04355 [Bacteroidetes bacterium]|nr:hypothetical protein [Bacteroidota bacterium]
MSKNKIYTVLILLCSAFLLYWLTQRAKPGPATTSLPQSKVAIPSLTPFWKTLPIRIGENQGDWLQRQRGEDSLLFDFFVQKILQSDPKTVYSLWQNPGVDSLTQDVTAFWDSNNPEVIQARQDLTKLLGRYPSLLQTAGGFSPDSLPPLPVPVGMVGLFQYQCVLSDSNLWIGLDLFMKESYRYYPTVDQLYLYQRRRTHPRHMPIAVARTLSEDLVDQLNPGSSSGKLLNQLLREGRIMACLRLLVPETPDSLLLGYDPDQWKWICQNENEVWKNLVRSQALFSEDPLVTARYLSDGPFTSGLSPSSPPALGRFLGDRIMQQWLANQKPTKGWIKAQGPPEQILQESGYRGRSSSL